MPRPRPVQPRALSPAGRRVLAVLHDPDMCVADQAPATVCTRLLDAHSYLRSAPTMYWILRPKGEVRVKATGSDSAERRRRPS